jgi:hypothetical protein
MAETTLHDLRAIDGDVARAAANLERWRTRILADATTAEDDDPFEGVRHVAAKSTRDGLRELPVSAADEPLRRGLVRWVGVLIEARVGLIDDARWAEAANAASVRYDGDEPRTVSWREGWRELVAARSAGEARRWLTAIADAAPAIASVERAAAARRLEVTRRLGFDHPWNAEERQLPADARDLSASARAWLDATDDLARAERRAIAREGADAPVVLHAAMARTASDGWPARLTPQWFDDVFGKGPRGLPIRAAVWPRPLGAASFVRALVAFGRAVRIASVPRALPFALGQDPCSLAGHRLGAVFGALGADPEFHARGLHTGRRTAAAQARALAATILVDTRLEAARLLLGDDARPAPADLFEEVTTRVFGAPMDSRLSGAWPRRRNDEPERWTAILEARAAREWLRDRFDVDWFRNPRAWDELRASDLPRSLSPPTAAAGAPPSTPAWQRELATLARSFEEALG